jgi:Holliday junction resolvasome RuvABC endonuclease subunit
VTRIIGIDIGLASMGWAVGEVHSGTMIVSQCGVWRTAKETKRRQLHVGSDDARRIDLLADHLRALMEEPAACVLGYELPAAAKGARAAHALGIAHGLVRASVRGTHLVAVEVTARDVKAALAGTPNASKEEMIAAAGELCGAVYELPKSIQEHAADAVGVVLATFRSAVGRAAVGSPKVQP